MEYGLFKSAEHIKWSLVSEYFWFFDICILYMITLNPDGKLFQKLFFLYNTPLQKQIYV